MSSSTTYKMCTGTEHEITLICDQQADVRYIFMLRTFFEKTDEDTSVYFVNKKIWNCGRSYREHQGKYDGISELRRRRRHCGIQWGCIWTKPRCGKRSTGRVAITNKRKAWVFPFLKQYDSSYMHDMLPMLQGNPHYQLSDPFIDVAILHNFSLFRPIRRSFLCL